MNKSAESTSPPPPGISLIELPEGYRFIGGRSNMLFLLHPPGQREAAEKWYADLWRDHPELIRAVRKMEVIL